VRWGSNVQAIDSLALLSLAGSLWKDLVSLSISAVEIRSEQSEREESNLRTSPRERALSALCLPVTSLSSLQLCLDVGQVQTRALLLLSYTCLLSALCRVSRVPQGELICLGRATKLLASSRESVADLRYVQMRRTADEAGLDKDGEEQAPPPKLTLSSTFQASDADIELRSKE